MKCLGEKAECLGEMGIFQVSHQEGVFRACIGVF